MATPESFDISLDAEELLTSCYDQSASEDQWLWYSHEPIELLSNDNHAVDKTSWLLDGASDTASQDGLDFWFPSCSEVDSSAPTPQTPPSYAYRLITQDTIAIHGTENEAEATLMTGHKGREDGTDNNAETLLAPRRRKLEAPKAAHGKVEKKYRHSLSSCLQRLSAKVPTICQQDSCKPHQCQRKFQGLEITHKRTKSSILKKALEYVEYLEKRCQLLESGQPEERIRAVPIEFDEYS